MLYILNKDLFNVWIFKKSPTSEKAVIDFDISELKDCKKFKDNI